MLLTFFWKCFWKVKLVLPGKKTYVPYVLTCRTYLLSSCLLLLTCLPFFTCLTYPYLFTCLVSLYFFTCLASLHFVTCLSFFKCLLCPHLFTCLTFFTCLHFLSVSNFWRNSGIFSFFICRTTHNQRQQAGISKNEVQ